MNQFLKANSIENPLHKTPYELALEQENHRLRAMLSYYENNKNNATFETELEVLTLDNPYEPVRLVPVATVGAEYRDEYPDAGYQVVVQDDTGFHMSYQIDKIAILQENPNGLKRVMGEMHLRVLKSMAQDIYERFHK